MNREIKMGKILGWWIWIKPRLKEPSTFASLAAITAMFGAHITTEDLNNVLNVATIVFGSLGFFVAEQHATTIVK